MKVLKRLATSALAAALMLSCIPLGAFAEVEDGNRLPGGIVSNELSGDDATQSDTDNEGHREWTAQGLFQYVKDNSTPGSAEYEDAAYALKVLRGTDNDHYLDVASSVMFDNSCDAVSLESMKTSLSFIDVFNSCRERENASEGTTLSTNVGTNCTMLAISIVQCDWSRDTIAHSQAYGVGENLAWGFTDPFSGWYDYEKSVYQEAIAEGRTPDYSEVGHYLNIVEPGYKVTGFATTESSMWGVCHEQSFSSGASVVYTAKQFRSKWFNPYYKAMKRQGMGVKFNDVTKGAWYFDVVRRAVGSGFMHGYGGDRTGDFGPNDSITRAQVVTILWNMAGSPAAGGGAKDFSDLDNGKYYAEAVRWASSVRVVSGYNDGTFKPDKPVTREELATMLCNYARYCGLPMDGATADSYASMSDASDVSSYAQKSMGWCFSHGILSGSGGRIDPKGTATRAQMAKMSVKVDDLS